jgi:hypothetical protein
VLSFAFVVLATVLLYLSSYACLRRTLSVPVAAPIAFGVTAAVPQAAKASGMFELASLLFALLVLYRRGRGGAARGWDPLPAVALAVVGAVLLQVKVNNGVAVLLLAAIVAVCVPSWRAALTGAVATLAAGVVAFGVWWVAAQQRLGDIAGYLRGSVEISSGYPEAMGVEGAGQVVGYLAAGAVAVLVGVLLVRLLRRQVSAAAVGTAVAAAAVLELGFKHGFVRHGPGHEETYFMVAGFVLIALAAWFGRDRAVLVVGLCAIAMVPGTLRLYDPVAARNQLRSGLELLLDKPYRVDALAARQQLLRDRYQLPAAIVGAATGHPVQIDPWEASAAWAYKFDWHPVPVFQLYSAYTPYLDQLNADAIVRAPADQVVLEGVSGSIDDRNPWWESPRYRLALLCDYVPVAAEGSWTALRHGANRCDGARGLGSRTVAAGEQVDTPAVGPDEVLVARFTPTPDGLPTKVVHLVLKDWSPIRVRAGGTEFRVPQALADGPLLISVPASVGWIPPFTYPQLGFNHPGTVTFEAITLSG